MNVEKTSITLLFLAMLFSGMVSFYHFFLTKNYTVFANIECDPTLHSCFKGTGEDTPETYAVVERSAFDLPQCTAWYGECPALSCAEGDTHCTVQYCAPSSGESCSSPDQ